LLFVDPAFPYNPHYVSSARNRRAHPRGSVRRSSGLVLVGNPYLGITSHLPATRRPLLKLSRDTVVRLRKTEYTLVSSLQREPLLADPIKRLRTVPGVGPITALAWALEIGDVARFRSIRQTISYCGLWGEEKSSADKVMRTPLSKQRNKHIQRVLTTSIHVLHANFPS
jgi:transposase